MLAGNVGLCLICPMHERYEFGTPPLEPHSLVESGITQPWPLERESVTETLRRDDRERAATCPCIHSAQARALLVTVPSDINNWVVIATRYDSRRIIIDEQMTGGVPNVTTMVTGMNIRMRGVRVSKRHSLTIRWSTTTCVPWIEHGMTPPECPQIDPIASTGLVLVASPASLLS